MQFFHWSYTRAEQVRILCKLFPRLKDTQAGTLLGTYPGEPVAFYSQLRRLWDVQQVRFRPESLASDMERALRGEWRPPSVPEPSGKQLIRFAASVIGERDAKPEEQT